MLGNRGRAHGENSRPHHRDHARVADPDRRLWLPSRRCTRPGRAAPACQGDLSVRTGRPRHGDASTRRARPARRPDRDPQLTCLRTGPAMRRRAAVGALAIKTGGIAAAALLAVALAPVTLVAVIAV